MRKRGARPLKELYDLTDRIAEPEITPVLEGSCRIQGPVDEPEQEPLRTSEDILHAGERYTFVNKNHHPRLESGACNVCCAPCSSCMHLNRTASVMESKIESSFSGNTFGRKESDSSFLGVDGLYSGKNRTCDDNLHAASETSNFICASSSHDSYSENAESKTTFKASVIYTASDVVDMPLKVASAVAVGDSELLPEKSSAPAPSSFSSDNQNIPHGRHRTSLSQDEEQRGSECPNTSLSCVTGLREAIAVAVDSSIEKKDLTNSSASTSGKGVDSSVQIGALRGFHDHETEESLSNSRMSSRGEAESAGHKSAASTCTDSGFSNTPAVLLPAVHSLSSHSQKGHFMFNVNSKGSEGKTSSESQIELFGCALENAESSLGRSRAAVSVEENTHIEVENYEDNQGSIRSRDNSSVALNNAEGSLGSDIGIVGGSSNNSGSVDEQLETLDFETSNMESSKMQQQLTVEFENSESDGALDDVKICDTCGDGGREFELAICSRCSDGAQHIYCMRIKLTKLPEGDWLCEECQTMEENKDLKADKRESVSRSLIPTSLMEEGSNSVRTSNHKLLTKLDTKEVDPERGITKRPETAQTSSLKQPDNLMVSLTTSRKASETCGGPIGTNSPRKKTVLSTENSFKDLDMAKAKPENRGRSCGNQAASNTSKASRLHASVGSKSFKVQPPIHSPRVLFPRSNSFNNPNMKPSSKVKHIIESTPHKKKFTRESTCFDLRKDGVSRSASFKSGNLSHSNAEAGGKSRTLNLSQGDDPGGLKQLKGKNLTEKKNSILNCTLVTPPVSDSGALHLKHDLKVVLHDAKLKNTSENKSSSINKGSDDANNNGCKEAKKLISCAPKNIGNQSTDRSCNSEDQKPFHVSKESVHASSAATIKSSSKPSTVLHHGVTQAVEPLLYDDRYKEPAAFSSKKQVVSGSNRIQRCQKCNEIGHAAQFCLFDRLSISAPRSSIQRNSRVIKKSCKLKDATEVTCSNSRLEKNNGLTDWQAELKIPCLTTNCDVASEDAFSNSLSGPFCRGLPVLGGKAYDQKILTGLESEPDKEATVIAVKQQAVQPKEAGITAPVSNSNVVSTISDELSVKPVVPNQVSLLVDSLRASAIPELQVIWQGRFEVLRSGRIPMLFGGIQAHLSTCASPKVLEVVTELPCEFQLEEVPFISSWPLQFQGSSAKEDNIALFFFAKDIESYDKSYLKLLENMLLKDVALKGNISGVELLIFPSNKLSASFQRWNSLYFLWGVLRGRRNNCSEAPSRFKKHLFDSISCKDPMVHQDLPSLPVEGVYCSKKIKLCEKPDMELPICDGSSKLQEMMSTTAMDTLPLPSSGFVDETCKKKLPPVFDNSFCQSLADNKLHSGTASVDINCSFNNMNQKLSILDTCTQWRPQLTDTTICCEGNLEATCQEKKLNTGVEGREFYKHLTHIHGNNAKPDGESCPVYEGSSNFRQGAEDRKLEDKVAEKTNSIKAEGVQEDGKEEILIERPELVSNRKRSAETLSSSGESSKSTLVAEADYVPIKGEKDHKRIKCFGENASSSRDENLRVTSSCRIQAGSDSNSNELQYREDNHSESENHAFVGAERCLFPMGLTHGSYPKPDHIINVPSDDEGLPEPSLPKSYCPDLELALWSTSQAKTDGVKMDKLPGPMAEDEASLSLSLGFPSAGKKPIFKKEKLIPDLPDLNAELLL